MPGAIPAEIFKAYDIRGIVGVSLTPAICRRIARAFADAAAERNVRCVALGCDGRLSSPALMDAVRAGLLSAGMEVIDVGAVTTPMLYFAAHILSGRTGLMVTGSHNPPEYNGLKLMLDGVTLAEDAIQDLYRRCLAQNLLPDTQADPTGQRMAAHGAPGRMTADQSGRAGLCRDVSIDADYLARICGDVRLARPLRVVIDAGNGIAGRIAPTLFRALGCTVETLFCEVDGHFPNHHPDPSRPENLRALQEALVAGNGEIGLAFDGDGDRLGVVTREGRIIHADRLLMLLAADVLARVPGAEILFDLKCSQQLFAWVHRHGGRPAFWKTGHSLMKARLQQTGAQLAGEMSGHIYFAERWYGFDDGLYAAARLLECLSQAANASALLDALPDALATPELQVPMGEGEAAPLVQALQRSAPFAQATEVITLDGVRFQYPDGFALARASNTTPILVLRFEAQDAAAMDRIQSHMRAALLALCPALKLPF